MFVGLYGETAMDGARMDAVLDHISDMLKEIRPALPAFGKSAEEKAAIFKKYLDEKATDHVMGIEKFIQDSSGHVVKGKVSAEVTW